MASLLAQMVKNLLAIKRHRFDPWVWKIPREGKATHSSILAWKIPWTEPGRLYSVGSQRARYN